MCAASAQSNVLKYLIYLLSDMCLATTRLETECFVLLYPSTPKMAMQLYLQNDSRMYIYIYIWHHICTYRVMPNQRSGVYRIAASHKYIHLKFRGEFLQAMR